MKNAISFRRYLPYFLFTCLILSSLACGAFVLPTSVPTTTAPTEIDSPLKSNLLGQWKISNGGTWGGATLTFEDDGSFSVVGGLQEKDAKGNYFFTSENVISFSLPSYKGSATIEFNADNQMSLTVTTSDEPFGLIYSAKKVK